MNNKGILKRHSFEPGAMSIIQMGEELIGHPSTAINELVKNGYDADAQNCHVYFHYSTVKEETFAIIKDNGNGMDFETLFGDWLKPSVSSKRKLNAKSDKFQRNLLGSKGIGRLAAMALGSNITVISREVDTRPYNWITVNRESFKQEKLLSEISFPGDTIAKFSNLFSEEEYLAERELTSNQILVDFFEKNNFDDFIRGTLIVIENLDDSVLKILYKDFNQTEIPDEIENSYKSTRFYKALATLITPLNLNKEIQRELLKMKIIKKKISLSADTSSFQIHYGTNLIPEQEDIEWLLVDPLPIQNVYDYRVYGKVTNTGEVEGYISFQRLENDKHQEQFHISREVSKGKISQGKLFSKDEDEYETGEYYFDIRVYDIGESDNREKLAKKINLSSGNKFRQAFKEVQGLRVSKNGFGVKPYGEEVEDWIGLSKARVQEPGKNVNTNQILGYIFFFSPENENLEEKTNREGFLENKAFQEVKDTLRDIFANLGRKRYNYRLLHGLGRVPSSKHIRPNFEEFTQTLNEFEASSKILKYSEKFMQEINTSLDNLEESLSFSERLASLGSGIELVYHEMAQPISGLKTTKSSLNFKKNKISEEAKDSFLQDISTLQHATTVLSELRKSLQPAIGRSRKKKFKPYETFLRVCNLFNSDFEERKIQVIADKNIQKIELSNLEYAFWITFLNIINNAVYWIKKSEREGKISIFLENNSIVISNTGPFINEKIIDHIFSYGVTTRSEKSATGLGLAFSQSIMSRIDWEISAENRTQGPAFIIKNINNE